MKEIDANTRCYIFVKGEDDFGRAPISSQQEGMSSYSVLWIRPKVGDIMHFLYPQQESAPLFIVTKETSHWVKDELQHSEGEMKLFPASNGVGSWQSWIDANRAKHHDFVERHTKEANRRYTAARAKLVTK